MYVHEIKYFRGDYIIRNNQWFTLPTDREISNPFIQLKRTETNVRQLLQTSNFSKKVIANVVFMHEEFTLYQASPQLPMVLPMQVRATWRTSLPRRRRPASATGNLPSNWCGVISMPTHLSGCPIIHSTVCEKA